MAYHDCIVCSGYGIVAQDDIVGSDEGIIAADTDIVESHVFLTVAYADVITRLDELVQRRVFMADEQIFAPVREAPHVIAQQHVEVSFDQELSGIRTDNQVIRF
jgi:hypothetical protein